jgi:glycerophosphoryl diester phosphodiesterase
MIAALLYIVSPAQAARSRMYQACHAERIVVHRGVVNLKHPRKGPNEDTLPAMRAAATRGIRVIEGDIQPTRDLAGINMHDRTVDRATNGHGVLNRMSYAQVRRLRTPAGSKLATFSEALSFFRSHPDQEWQMEMKHYSAWPDSFFRKLVHGIQSSHLQNRVQPTSMYLPFLLKVQQLDPSLYLEWIGSGDAQPNLATAAAYGIPQVNVTYVAAFRPYGGYSTYVAAAHAYGIALSVRSHEGGNGDSAYWWEREMRAGVHQIVIQSAGKWQNWCNAQ